MNAGETMSFYQWVLFIFVCTSIGAELVALALPRKICALLEMTPTEAAGSLFTKIMSLLSLIYVATIVLLLFAGDRVFAMYGSILIVLSGLLWFLRRRVRYFRALIAIDSTICLILLIDVARTLLRVYR